MCHFLIKKPLVQWGIILTEESYHNKREKYYCHCMKFASMLASTKQIPKRLHTHFEKIAHTFRGHDWNALSSADGSPHMKHRALELI